MLGCATNTSMLEGKYMSVLRFVPALALLLLSGCQHSSQPSPTPTTDPAVRCTGAEQARCVWINTIQQRVIGNFDRADRYRGQHCDVMIGYDPRRGYQVLRTDGDEALCLKAWQAVSSADALPPPPAGAPQQIMVTFRPR